MEPEVRIALSPPPAQATAHQAFRRPPGRNRVREGVLIFSTAKRVLPPPSIDCGVGYNQQSAQKICSCNLPMGLKACPRQPGGGLPQGLDTAFPVKET